MKGKFESNQIDKLLMKGAIPTEETLNSIIESKSWTSQHTKDDLIIAMLKVDVFPLENILNYAVKFKVYIPTLEAVLNKMSEAGLVPTDNALKIAIQVSDYPLLELLLKEILKNGFIPSEDVFECAIANNANSFIMGALLGAGIVSTEKISETLNSIIESKSWTSRDTKDNLIKAVLKTDLVPLENILDYAIKFEVYTPTFEAVLNKMSKAGMLPSGQVLEFALEKKSYIPIIKALLKVGIIPTEKALILAKQKPWYNDLFKEYTK